MYHFLLLVKRFGAFVKKNVLLNYKDTQTFYVFEKKN
jgi:hypothetical protein